MRKTRLDQLCAAMFVLAAVLIVILCVVGCVSAAVRRQTEKARRDRDAVLTATADMMAELPERFVDANEMVRNAWEPVRAEPEEDPDEGAKIYAALLDKCQVVPDCYIVGYAPELVAGWRDEYRNENGLYMTASGNWAMPGYTVATDPAVIPTGATVVIEGRVYVAADRGVTGKVIDVMLSPEEALTYGCHRADVYWCLEGEEQP